MSTYDLLLECGIKFREGNFLGALSVANKIIEEKPKWHEGYCWKAKCYKEIFYQEQEKLREEKSKEMEETWRRAWRRDKVFSKLPWKLYHDIKMMNIKFPEKRAKSYIEKIVKNYKEAIQLLPQDEEIFIEFLDFFNSSEIYQTYGKRETFSLFKELCETYYLSQLYLWNAVLHLAYSEETEAIDDPGVSDILLEFAKKMIGRIKRQYETKQFNLVKKKIIYPINMQVSDYSYLIEALFVLRDILDKKRNYEKLEEVMWEIVLTSFYNDIKNFIYNIDRLSAIGGYCECHKFIAELEKISKSKNPKEMGKEISSWFEEMEKHRSRTGFSREEVLREIKLHNRVSEFKHITSSFIEKTLKDEYGDKWWEECIPYWIQEETKKRKKDKKYIPNFKDIYVGVYSHIIQFNWQLFKDIFPSKEWVKERFSVLHEARIDESHRLRAYSDSELKKLDEIIEKIIQYAEGKK